MDLLSSHAPKYVVFTIGKLPKLPKGFLQAVAPQLDIELAKNMSRKCTHLLISEKTKAAAMRPAEEEDSASNLKATPVAHRVSVSKALKPDSQTAIVHEDWIRALCAERGIPVPTVDLEAGAATPRKQRKEADVVDVKSMIEQQQQPPTADPGDHKTLEFAASDEAGKVKSTRGRKPKSPSGKSGKAPRKPRAEKPIGERKQKKEEVIMVDKPLVELTIGAAPTEFKSVRIQRVAANVYRCTCAAFDNPRLHPSLRTCRHLAALLGEGFERHRMYQAENALRPPVPSIEFKQPLMTPSLWPSSPTADPNGFLMMPRVTDSVSCVWTKHGLFNAQTGIYIHAPEWWTSSLPRDGAVIQGDIAFMRQEKSEGTTREKLLSLCKSTDWSRQGEWKQVIFFVWDLPLLVSTGDETCVQPCILSQRLEELRRCVEVTKCWGEHVCLLPHIECIGGLAHAKSTLDRFRTQGFAGLYFRPPRSTYAFEKKSSTMQELKVFIVEEAKVLNHAATTAGAASRVNVLEVISLKRGVSFNLPLRSVSNPPAVGSIIRFQYQELDPHTGIPRTPTYLGYASASAGGGNGMAAGGGNKRKKVIVA